MEKRALNPLSYFLDIRRDIRLGCIPHFKCLMRDSFQALYRQLMGGQ